MEDNASPLESPEVQSAINKYHPFLIEARKRFLYTLIVFGVTTIAGFFYYEKIIRFLIQILSLQGINIVFTSPFQFINLAISVGMACGFIITIPLIVFQILSFLKPGLKEKEFRLLIKYLPFSFILFVAGFTFGTLIMKWQIEIFLSKSIEIGIGNILDISRLLTTVVMTSVIMGLAFEFPLVLLLLLRIGVIKRHKLIKLRLWIYLASFVFAILLPIDSIIGDALLSLPLIILFELTLILSKFGKR